MDENVFENLNEEERAMAQTLAGTASALLENGVLTLAEIRGVSHDQLEAVYRVGFGLYNAGKYDDAEKLFRFLCVFQHTDPKYWVAMGAVRAARKNYAEAVKAYATASMFDCNLPKPHYYAAQCFLAMGDYDSAESGVVSLLELCPAGDPTNNKYRALATALREKIAALRKAKELRGDVDPAEKAKA